MTIIGKILTFLIFFLSLVFLGFAVSINSLNKDPISKQSWYQVADDYRKMHIPNLIEDVKERDKIIVDHQAEINKLRKELDETKVNLDKKVSQARDQVATAQAVENKVKMDFKDYQVAADIAVFELKQRRDEAVALQKTIKDKDLAMADIESKLSKMTNEKVSAQVAAGTYLERLKSMEKHNQELVREIERERERAADQIKPGSAQELVRRPPPDDVHGKVKSVTTEGLVSITIGSDAGLLRGHTLEVFRTEPKAQYLGVIRIVEVSPHESVGQLLTPQFKKLVQKDDQVASKILPSR